MAATLSTREKNTSEGVKSARAEPSVLIPSHAYLYRFKDNHGTHDYTEVIVTQGATIGYLACYLPDEDHPQTPGQLSALLQSTNCSTLGGDWSDPTSHSKTKLVHQRVGNRFLVLSSAMIIGDITSEGKNITLSMVSSWTSVFSPDHSDALNKVITGVGYPVGENPAITTLRLTGLREYDADIQYKKINEMPIEQ